MKNLKVSHFNTILFPEIIDSRRDNNTFTYLANSKELERYLLVLISLYPISDPRLLSTVKKIKFQIDVLWTNNGAKYTVAYLKECNRLLQFFVAGNPQEPDSTLRLAAPSGLPNLIPANHRALIINNKDHRDYKNLIRIIFALLGCYRLIRYPGELKLHTIVDKSESKGLNPWEIGYTLSTKFKHQYFDKTKFDSPSYELLSLTTAGPNNRISILSAPLDALALRGTDLVTYLKVLSDFFKLGTYSLLKRELEVLSDIPDDKIGLQGKLSIKEEPAGKRRVFAIVDIWTQSVLKPMHDHVFSILKLIPQDGAFDQLKPVKALISRNKEGKTFCYDLSAATDRFPIDVQVDLLSFLYNRDVANAWKGLLVDRYYYLRETNSFYQYGCGQPMGALSSWGVFSLAHHLIVQIAATRLGHKEWFSEYALLGDDIVITNEAVASEYYKIMTEELRVSINKSKSLQSNIGIMEFAKRIIGPQGDFSPVGPKNVSLFLSNKLNIPNLLVDLREKGIGIDYFFVHKLLTKLKKKSVFKLPWLEFQALTWSLVEPFGFLRSYTHMSHKWVKSLRPLKAEEVFAKLLKFMEKEWSLKHERALTSCRECIDKYESFAVIYDSIIDVRLIPSLMEQKLKLIEEYARLQSLRFPKIVWKRIEPSVPFGTVFKTPFQYYSYQSMEAPIPQIYVKILDENNKRVASDIYNATTPEYMMMHAINFLSENLPPVVPMTSIFADINVNRRSLRHVNYQFIKKFMAWNHLV